MKLLIELTVTELGQLLKILEIRIRHTNSRSAIKLFDKLMVQYEYQRKRDNKTA